MKDMELITRQEPGLVEFYNFEDLKTILEAELVRYQNIAYSEDDLKEAMADQKKLKDLRKAIDDKRKEIKKIYMQPYEVVELQTKELIALIDEPLKAIAAYLDSAKEAEKAKKKALKEKLKTHEMFYCPKCKASCFVPRGKGKVRITCPKCGAKFIGKT